MPDTLLKASFSEGVGQTLKHHLGVLSISGGLTQPVEGLILNVADADLTIVMDKILVCESYPDGADAGPVEFLHSLCHFLKEEPQIVFVEIKERHEWVWSHLCRCLTSVSLV